MLVELISCFQYMYILNYLYGDQFTEFTTDFTYLNLLSKQTHLPIVPRYLYYVVICINFNINIKIDVHCLVDYIYIGKIL